MYRYNIFEIKNKTHGYITTEISRLFLKVLLYNNLDETPFNFSHILSFLIYFEKKNRLKTKTRYRNYCLVTGSTHGIYRGFKLTRMKCREYALNGLLLGVKKGSW